nr:unnamed protein product [Callosobruchus analis]
MCMFLFAVVGFV